MAASLRSGECWQSGRERSVDVNFLYKHQCTNVALNGRTVRIAAVLYLDTRADLCTHDTRIELG